MRSIACIHTYSNLSQEKSLFQSYEYHNLNLLNEKFKVISPHGFDMGNIGFMELIMNIVFTGVAYLLYVTV